MGSEKCRKDQTALTSRKSQANDYNAYMALRKAGDEAWSRQDWATVENNYLDCVNKLDSLKLEREHRKCIMLTGAGVAAAQLKKFSRALNHYQNAAKHLNSQEDCFLIAFNYLTAILTNLQSYNSLKTSAHKAQCRNLRRHLFEKFKRHILTVKAPPPKADDASRKRHGEVISDPFAYLENFKDERTRNWLNQLQKHSLAVLNLSLLNYENPRDFHRVGNAICREMPYRIGDYYYFRETENGTIHRTIKRAKSAFSKPRVVFRGKDICPEGYYIAETRFHKNGKLVAYGLTKNGSDWEEWRVKNLNTGKDLPHILLRVRTGEIAFHPDGKGLIYWKRCKQPTITARRGSKKTPASGAGQSQPPDLTPLGKEVEVVYQPLSRSGRPKTLLKPLRDDTAYLSVSYVSKDIALVRELVPRTTKGITYLEVFKSKSKQNSIIPLFGGKPNEHNFVGTRDGKLYFISFEHADRGELIALELNEKKLEISKPKVIIPQGQDILQRLRFTKESIIAQYLTGKGEANQLRVFRTDGTACGEIPLPFKGFVVNLSTNRQNQDVLYSILHFNEPVASYFYNLRSKRLRLLFPQTVKPTADIVKKLIQVKASDGKEIPMWMVHRKSVRPDKNTPALMNVYGGFRIAWTPFHSYELLSWTALGGIWLQPYLRGGNELGKSWHDDATLEKKQRTYDDVFDCADYVIKNKITSARKLAIQGTSNGGLTVGAVTTQKPGLFGAAIAVNGLFDMLKFADHTVGAHWEAEYGSVSKKKQFQVLRGYSPCHNIPQHGKDDKQKKFPPLLLCAAEADDRVPPWHSYKFAAALLAAQTGKGGNPVVLRLEKGSGHNRRGYSWEIRDKLAFLKLALEF